MSASKFPKISQSNPQKFSYLTDFYKHQDFLIFLQFHKTGTKVANNVYYNRLIYVVLSGVMLKEFLVLSIKSTYSKLH